MRSHSSQCWAPSSSRSSRSTRYGGPGAGEGSAMLALREYLSRNLRGFQREWRRETSGTAETEKLATTTTRRTSTTSSTSTAIVEECRSGDEKCKHIENVEKKHRQKEKEEILHAEQADKEYQRRLRAVLQKKFHLLRRQQEREEFRVQQGAGMPEPVWMNWKDANTIITK